MQVLIPSLPAVVYCRQKDLYQRFRLAFAFWWSSCFLMIIVNFDDWLLLFECFLRIQDETKTFGKTFMWAHKVFVLVFCLLVGWLVCCVVGCFFVCLFQKNRNVQYTSATYLPNLQKSINFIKHYRRQKIMKFWFLPLGNITSFQNLGFILFNMFIYPKNNLSTDGVVCQNQKCKVAPLDTVEVPKTPVSYSKYNPSFCLFLLWFSKTQSVINKTEINWSISWRIYNTFNVMQTLIKYLQLTIPQQVIYKA